MVAEAFENGPRAAPPRLKDWLFNQRIPRSSASG